jgi:PadR family transcriptional regulator PadR
MRWIGTGRVISVSWSGNGSHVDHPCHASQEVRLKSGARASLLDSLGGRLLSFLLTYLGERPVTDNAEILPGTLDLLILKAVSLGRLHGYGVLLRIEQISGGALRIQQGALYPALYRLEHQGLIESEWGVSENNRRAKYYQLTVAGRKRFGEEVASWNRLADAIARALRTTPQEA